MEKICSTNLSDLFTQDFVLVEIIDCLDLQTLVKLKLLSKSVKEAIERENYFLFQKFREFLNIPTTFDSSDLPSKENIADIFKTVLAAIKSEPNGLSPFAFYTDGGVDTNSNYYFLQNLWKKTGICYCTIAHANVHVQSILSKTVDLPAADNNPMLFLENPKSKLKIRIPYENYTTADSDLFHLLTHFQVHLRSGGYNAYVQSFAVFYSE
jgi:hypothetical protein